MEAGFYQSPGWNKSYRKIQILTVEQLLNGAKVDMPPSYGTFQQAQRVQEERDQQLEFEL